MNEQQEEARTSVIAEEPQGPGTRICRDQEAGRVRRAAR
jgi:hypothetical protein